MWTAPSTQKIRPGDAAGSGAGATLEAARNEFEAFHVVINGGGAGAKAVTVAAGPLAGPDGAVIDDARVFREGMYHVATVSNVQGAAGPWPDAMIPAVDEIDHQTRNAFPVDVPIDQQQPVFVEYHVPAGAAAGWYTGTVQVTGGISADDPRQAVRARLFTAVDVEPAVGVRHRAGTTPAPRTTAAIRSAAVTPASPRSTTSTPASPSTIASPCPTSCTRGRRKTPTAATTGRRGTR